MSKRSNFLSKEERAMVLKNYNKDKRLSRALKKKPNSNLYGYIYSLEECDEIIKNRTNGNE